MKAPANAAHNMLDRMIEGPDCTDTARGTLLQVRSEVEKVVTRTRNLLFYSDLANGHQLVPRMEVFKGIEVYKLVHISVWHANLANKAKGLVFWVDENSFEPLQDQDVMLDKDLFEQAYQNVLDNAGRYSMRGSVIKVVCRAVPGECWSVSIINKGVSLSRGEAVRCMEPEWRSDRAKLTSAGTGTGLYVVDQCMRAQGGALDVCPTNEAGETNFGLRLPWLKRDL